MSGNMIKPLYSLCILGILFSTGAAAGTYKWINEDGNVVYSQRPPPSGQYESIRVKPSPRRVPGSDNAGKRSSDFLKNADTKRNDDAKVKAALEKTQALRKKNCATAKQQLEFYTVYRRKKDKNGEYVRIPDNERDAGLKEAKQAIKDFCD